MALLRNTLCLLRILSTVLLINVFKFDRERRRFSRIWGFEVFVRTLYKILLAPLVYEIFRSLKLVVVATDRVIWHNVKGLQAFQHLIYLLTVFQLLSQLFYLVFIAYFYMHGNRVNRIRRFLDHFVAVSDLHEKVFRNELKVSWRAIFVIFYPRVAVYFESCVLVYLNPFDWVNAYRCLLSLQPLLLKILCYFGLAIFHNLFSDFQKCAADPYWLLKFSKKKVSHKMLEFTTLCANMIKLYNDFEQMTAVLFIVDMGHDIIRAVYKICLAPNNAFDTAIAVRDCVLVGHSFFFIIFISNDIRNVQKGMGNDQLLYNIEMGPKSEKWLKLFVLQKTVRNSVAGGQGVLHKRKGALLAIFHIIFLNVIFLKSVYFASDAVIAKEDFNKIFMEKNISLYHEVLSSFRVPKFAEITEIIS